MANTVRLEQTFTDITGKDLSNTSQLKLFNILQDEDGVKFQNVWRSYSLNPEIAEETVFFTLYNMNDDDWWDNISYSAYDTPLLWWVLCVINNIQNPFEEVDPGKETNILRGNYIYQVIKEIEIISELGREG